MFARALVGATTLSLAGAVVVGIVEASATWDSSGPTAAAGPGKKTVWTEGDKTGFGTARTRRSNVWFTLQRGRMSEVFYPDLSTPSIRNLELVVTDGHSFADRESTDTRHRTIRPDPESLRFTQVNTAHTGKYRITKQVVTDPGRDTVRIRVRLTSLDGGSYRLFVLHDPALTNDGMDDRGRTAGRALLSTDGSVASALVSRPRFRGTSNGYLGVDDGWTDLEGDYDLDSRRQRVGPGNVVQTGRVGGITGLPGQQRFTLTLGFGRDGPGALRMTRDSASAGFTTTQRRYDSGWHRWLGSLRDVPASATTVRRQYLASALVVAAAEDKLHPGAIVASPSAPWVWGDEIPDLSSPSGAYHLVWSRDAYQFGTALWAMGDRAAARRIVTWLFTVQQKADGSFPQNSDVRGRPVWGSLQLDEVALPIALAHLVGKHDPATYEHVKEAANFIADFVDPETGRAAPYSPQERWENQSGYSPNSIAAQINGLVCAAHLARLNDDPTSARRWLDLADTWRSKLKGWTVTHNGPLSDDPYFLRLTKDGNPEAATKYSIGDGGPSSIDQRRVVDQSFLDLVRFGILRPRDPAVRATLPVVDQALRVRTPNGAYWHRFNFDGYGETRGGGEWRITDPDTFQTLGRAWPLLAGERGEYAVTRGGTGTGQLRAMARAAGPSDMLAEQVWDGRRPSGRPCCPIGEGTRSATPLVWSHSGLVRLAWTMQRGTPVDQQEIVARRYLP
jgi:glucoamylase